MSYIIRNRILRALAVGIVCALAAGVLMADRPPSADGTVAVLVPKTSLPALHIMQASDLATISVPRSALAALGSAPALASDRSLVVGQSVRTPLSQGRVIDLSDVYGASEGGHGLLSANQALYTLPLNAGSFPLPGLAPDSFVDVHALILRNDRGSSLAGNGSLEPSKALDASGLGSILIVSKARVFQVTGPDVTLIVPRNAVSTLNLVQALGTYSFSQVSPDAPVLDPESLSPSEIIEEYHVPQQ